MSVRTPRVVVLISGGGRTLLNLQDNIEAGTLSAEIVLVIASRQCPGVERARAGGLCVEIVQGDIEKTYFASKLLENRADWVVLAGYTRLCPIPDDYRGRIVNIHPALLPKFGGPGMQGMRVHRAVLEAGETESGCSVHFCDEEYDTGPVIAQRRCPVEAGDTAQILAARVFALELELFPEALEGLFERDGALADRTKRVL